MHPAKTGRDSALHAVQPLDAAIIVNWQIRIELKKSHWQGAKRQDKLIRSQLILKKGSQVCYRSMMPARRQGIEW